MAKHRHGAFEWGEMRWCQGQFQMLPTCSVGNEGRKEFMCAKIEIIMFHDNGKGAMAGSLQPVNGYMMLLFEGNAMVG
jgi:hypothetical protein